MHPIAFDLVNCLLNKGEDVEVDYASGHGHVTGVIRSFDPLEMDFYSITIFNALTVGAYSFHTMSKETLEQAVLKKPGKNHRLYIKFENQS